MPDTPVILAGAALLTLADGFTPADLKLLAVLLLIALVVEGLSYLAGVLGAKMGGASWKGVAGALLGGVVFKFAAGVTMVGLVVVSVLAK